MLKMYMVLVFVVCLSLSCEKKGNDERPVESSPQVEEKDLNPGDQADSNEDSNNPFGDSDSANAGDSVDETDGGAGNEPKNLAVPFSFLGTRKLSDGTPVIIATSFVREESKDIRVQFESSFKKYLKSCMVTGRSDEKVVFVDLIDFTALTSDSSKKIVVPHPLRMLQIRGLITMPVDIEISCSKQGKEYTSTKRVVFVQGDGCGDSIYTGMKISFDDGTFDCYPTLSESSSLSVSDKLALGGIEWQDSDHFLNAGIGYEITMEKSETRSFKVDIYLPSLPDETPLYSLANCFVKKERANTPYEGSLVVPAESDSVRSHSVTISKPQSSLLLQYTCLIEQSSGESFIFSQPLYIRVR